MECFLNGWALGTYLVQYSKDTLKHTNLQPILCNEIHKLIHNLIHSLFDPIIHGCAFLHLQWACELPTYIYAVTLDPTSTLPYMASIYL